MNKYILQERNIYVAYFVLLCYLAVWLVDKFCWIARFPE